ncbi:PWWP domain-containing protein [Heracleum sosnowskyi]|uniref:PWWP domain-containing protein n=1 Tax=Heracleum sosnowskyi TaxID=360622 RepID=A0AAD8MCY3_9APIA|nr:PWWP domain-containing protein [Heracleum sosnowskyi]
MKKLKAGSIVWVKRRNGLWWPGRIMGQNEVASSSSRLKCGSAKPVTLLGRDYTFVDWYNLESGRIKAFRCSEFSDFIKEAECLKTKRLRELVKCARRTDAILHALELEKKEPGKKRKKSDCTEEAHKDGPVCRSKRSRCVYLPVGSRNNSECTSFHAQRLARLVRMGGGGSYKSSSSQNTYSLRSTDTYSFDNYTPNGRADEISKQLSGCRSGYPGTKSYNEHEELSGLTHKDRTVDDVKAPKSKIIVKLKHLNNQYRDSPDGQRLVTSGNAIHDKSDHLNVDDALKCHTRTGCYGKQSKKLIRDIYFSSQFQDGGFEISGRQGRSTSSRKLLIDIKLKLETRYEGASVPLVSLMSKANRISIIGHPVEVEKLKNGSTEILLPINDDDAGNQMLDNKSSSLLQLFPKTRTPVFYPPTTSQLTRSVRTTARRTPVSYLPTPSPYSIKKEFQAVNVPTKKIHARLVKSENNHLPEEKIQNLHATVSSVPVKLIFSRLAAAVGLQPGADTHG